MKDGFVHICRFVTLMHGRNELSCQSRRRVASGPPFLTGLTGSKVQQIIFYTRNEHYGIRTTNMVPRPWQGWPALNYSISYFTQETSITVYVRPTTWTSRLSRWPYAYHRWGIPGTAVYTESKDTTTGQMCTLHSSELAVDKTETNMHRIYSVTENLYCTLYLRVSLIEEYR